MRELKPLHPELIPQALEKAKRYRLLNEPLEAESICRDILAADPDNQDALVWLLLALTDQIALGRTSAKKQARELIPQLTSAYQRAYYQGVLAERIGKALWRSQKPDSGYRAYEAMSDAMEFFEEAEGLSEADNDDAKLRWRVT